MNIRLLCIGTKMPGWIQSGYAEYARRLPKDNALELVELPLPRKGANNVQVQQQLEEKLLLGKVNKRDVIVALDEGGAGWTSQQLAKRMTGWREGGTNVALLIGGPDGLSDECKSRAQVCWSLSNATLPHALVRVLVAEQIYRAWSLNTNHPYHRA